MRNPHRERVTPAREWIKHGRSLDARLCVFTAPKTILTSCYLSIDPERHRLFGNQTYFEPSNWFNLRPQLDQGRYEFRSGNVIALPGRHAVIGGPIDNAYYHWLLNWAPRLVLLRTLWPELYHDPALKFAIDRRAKKEPYASFIRLLGVDPDRIVYVDDANDYAFEAFADRVAALESGGDIEGALSVLLHRPAHSWSDRDRERTYLHRWHA